MMTPSASPIKVGDPAPDFRLPTADGKSVGLSDYRDRRAVMLWFTKGIACPFCRQQMAQLNQALPRFRELRTELLQVTPTPPERAQIYFRRFSLPFPYLCDDGFTIYLRYGLSFRSHGLIKKGTRLVRSAMGRVRSLRSPYPRPMIVAPSEVAGLSADSDTGFFIVDTSGIIRFTAQDIYPLGLPGNEEILKRLAQIS
jgi:peroxiredoxin